MYPRSRILADPHAPNARGYDIRPAAGGMRIVDFVTGDLNGKTADEIAVSNLADLSEHHDQPLALHAGGLLPTYFNGCELVATAEYGAVTMAVTA